MLCLRVLLWLLPGSVCTCTSAAAGGVCCNNRHCLSEVCAWCVKTAKISGRGSRHAAAMTVPPVSCGATVLLGVCAESMQVGSASAHSLRTLQPQAGDSVSLLWCDWAREEVDRQPHTYKHSHSYTAHSTEHPTHPLGRVVRPPKLLPVLLNLQPLAGEHW